MRRNLGGLLVAMNIIKLSTGSRSMVRIIPEKFGLGYSTPFFPTPSVFYTSRKCGVLHLMYPTPFFIFLEKFLVRKTLFEIFENTGV